MAKRKPRWAVIYIDSLNGWSAFTVRGSNKFEATQAAKASPRLQKFVRFYVRAL